MIDPAVFKDKIVFIGLTASGLLDVFGTPMSATTSGRCRASSCTPAWPTASWPNRFIRPASRALAHRHRPDRGAVDRHAGGVPAVYDAAAIASLAILGGWTWFTVGAFKGGPWLNLVQPLAVGALALFFGHRLPVLRRRQGEAESREAVRPIRVARRLRAADANPDQAELGGKRREMTVLFSDIRGFTTVTERGNPEELVAQLNEYFSRMVEIVFRHKGTVDKFVGDMVMALFSAPLDDPDHADHAVAGGRRHGQGARRAEPGLGRHGAWRSSTSASASTPAT